MPSSAEEHDRRLQVWTRSIVNWSERIFLAVMIGLKFGAWYGWMTLLLIWVIVGFIQGTVRSVKEWGRWPYT